MKKLSWKLATLAQLFEIAYNDRCNPRYKIEAEDEIRRRTAAKRSNVKHRAMGRNYG